MTGHWNTTNVRTNEYDEIVATEEEEKTKENEDLNDSFRDEDDEFDDEDEWSFVIFYSLHLK